MVKRSPMFVCMLNQTALGGPGSIGAALGHLLGVRMFVEGFSVYLVLSLDCGLQVTFLKALWMVL